MRYIALTFLNMLLSGDKEGNVKFEFNFHE